MPKMDRVCCPVLSSESIGKNNALVCRRDKAELEGWICPRKVRPWYPCGTCANLNRLNIGMDAALAKMKAMVGITDDKIIVMRG
ncbi:MAG: hypothetical protein WC341_15045 [Bacteroidales bacterium]|jgi:hypothetical protein